MAENPYNQLKIHDISDFLLKLSIDLDQQCVQFIKDQFIFQKLEKINVQNLQELFLSIIKFNDDSEPHSNS